MLPLSICWAAFQDRLSGISGEREGLLDALLRTGARYMLQIAIEEEVTEFLGREHYQRGERVRQGYRNGYEPKRLVTGQGAIEVGVPQVRNTDEPFHSELLAAFTNGLAVLVKEGFNLDPFSPCLYVFCNRKRDKLKILKWDHNGFWLYYRRLEKGKFNTY